jgi:two-component system, NarL family, sensor histidine kinase UhpB
MPSPSSVRLAPHASDRPATAGSTNPQEHQRRLSRRGAPGTLLFQVFAGNAAVFIVAFLLLALTPITIHAPIRLSELGLLLAGLLLLLSADLMILRRSLGPLRRLAETMHAVDPTRPGRRAKEEPHAGGEILALAQAFNEMLDRVESERRNSARVALEAQEAERLRVARELHDEIGQTLTAIALRAEHAAAQAPADSETLSDIAATIKASLDDVRAIARELRPEALDDLGLVNALIALCSRVGRQGRLQVRREFEAGLPRLDPDVELVVYRVAQEALTNVLRHSQAGQVTVSLHRQGANVVLEIADDGRGIKEGLNEGSGIAGMRERAMLVGAELQIAAAAGRGVVVRLRFADGASH